MSRGYSLVVEHSIADREVPGSNPGIPCIFFKYLIQFGTAIEPLSYISYKLLISFW